MQYEGKVYRPWPEANSLLIQTTLGCTHNKCTFCDMFREKRFRIREIEDIFKDIDEAKSTIHRVESIFLIDGNVLALKTPFLVKILKKITATFPECKKNSLYAGLNDLRRKSIEELKELKQAGFDTFYWGDHGNNIIPIKGNLPEWQEVFLDRVNHAIATHPVCKEETLKTLAW